MKAKRKNLGDTLRAPCEESDVPLPVHHRAVYDGRRVRGGGGQHPFTRAEGGLLEYLGYFFRGLEQNTIAEPKIAFQHSMGDHLKTLGLMWILGLSIIGIPLILILIFLKGLVIGFTVGFLVSQLSWRGLWFAFVVGGSPKSVGCSRHDHHCGVRNPFFRSCW